MTKKIYILRHITFMYVDDWYCPSGIGSIYKKYSNKEEAQKEKDKLEVEDFKEGVFEKTGYRGLSQKEMAEFCKGYFPFDVQAMLENENFQSNVFQFAKKSWSYRDSYPFNRRDYSDLKQQNIGINEFVIQGYIQYKFEESLLEAGDELILKYIRELELESYKLFELEENAKFYIIEINPNFKDYKNHSHVWDEIWWEDINDQDDLEKKWKLLTHIFACELSDDDNDLKYLKGSLEELSPAPDMLEAYIKANQNLIFYDSHKKILHLQNYSFGIYYGNEHLIIKGLIALLKPDKFPLIIKEVPLSEIEETSKK